MPEENHHRAILRGLFVYNIDNGGIVTEKYDTFICHARPQMWAASTIGKSSKMAILKSYQVVGHMP